MIPSHTGTLLRFTISNSKKKGGGGEGGGTLAQHWHSVWGERVGLHIINFDYKEHWKTFEIFKLEIWDQDLGPRVYYKTFEICDWKTFEIFKP
jgi:hypothetical protein